MEDLWQARANRWMGLGGGVAFGVLTIVGWSVWAQPNLFHSLVTAPNVAASPASISRYYIEHAADARVGALLGSIALLPMLCFLVAMFNRLRVAEGGTHPFSSVMLLGGFMVCVEHFLFCGFLFQAAFEPKLVGPEVTAAWHWSYAAGGAAFITYTTFLLGVAVVSLRYRASPRWLGVSALAVALLQLLYIPSAFGQFGVFDPLSGALGVYVPFGTFLVWCIAAGVALGQVPAGGARPVERVAQPGLARLGV